MKGWNTIMKKILSVVLFTLLFAFSSIASAEINSDEVALGGLVPRTDISNAYDMYGNPDRVENDTRFFWGNGFQIDINNHREMISIKTSANNGIATPSGLHVGCTVNDVYKVYGKPDSVYNDFTNTKTGVNHCYEGGWNCLIFTSVNDRIVSIVAIKNIK